MWVSSFIRDTVLSSLQVLVSCAENQGTLPAGVCSCAVEHVPLPSVPAFKTAPWFPGYSCWRIYLEIKQCDISTFESKFFVYYDFLIILSVVSNNQGFLSYFSDKCHWNFDSDCIKSVGDYFGCHGQLNNIDFWSISINYFSIFNVFILLSTFIYFTSLI